MKTYYHQKVLRFFYICNVVKITDQGKFVGMIHMQLSKNHILMTVHSCTAGL